jgi:prepilin-type N-terminal cleavage/methylation domain-containing protein
MKTQVTGQAGFSMVELLVALLMLGIVSTAAFNFYTQQHESMVQQVDVSDTQQGLRATMDEITRKIHLAGYRVFGGNAVMTLNDNTWLALRYHDGTAVRTQLFFPYINTATGRTDLMTMLDGESMQVFAEGIDSMRFTPGSTGTGIQWITVELVAKTARPGFQTASTFGETGSGAYLYRRLSSVVGLRNR